MAARKGLRSDYRDLFVFHKHGDGPQSHEPLLRGFPGLWFSVAAGLQDGGGNRARRVEPGRFLGRAVPFVANRVAGHRWALVPPHGGRRCPGGGLGTHGRDG